MSNFSGGGAKRAAKKKRSLLFADTNYSDKTIAKKLLEVNMSPIICAKGRKGSPIKSKAKKLLLASVVILGTCSVSANSRSG